MPTDLRRLVAALFAGLVCAVGLTVSLGLLTSTPHGAADNGDGLRLYCGAGLIPETDTGASAWQPGVVLQYREGPECTGPPPSSALVALETAADLAGGPDFDLRSLAWIYLATASLITTLGAWSASAGGLGRIGVLLPGLVALLTQDFARFLLSTYAEPAGLIGAYAMMTGAAVLVVTTPAQRWPRIIALALVVTGSLWAVSAKVAYAPLLVVSVILALSIGIGTYRRRWRAHLGGALAALLLIVAGGALVKDASHWQYTLYKGTNVANLIYTLVLTEIPDGASELGLPPAAQQLAGTPRPLLTSDQPGLAEIDNDPSGYRGRATRLLLENPQVAARALGIGMQATAGSSLHYLVWWPVGEHPNVRGVTEAEGAGESGADPVQLRRWLADVALPWWPSVLAAAGVLVGIAGLWRRRARAAPLAILAGIAAISALGLVVAALADGYFELPKHVWLGAYFLHVTAWSLLGAICVLGWSLAFPLRRPPVSPEPATAPM